jgi:hypothetical protein
LKTRLKISLLILIILALAMPILSVSAAETHAGNAFKGLWDTHIGFFVDYVVATANNDEEGRQAARDELDDYGKYCYRITLPRNSFIRKS